MKEQIQIGLLANHLRKNGVFDINIISETIHKRKEKDVSDKRFVYDRYAEYGSSSNVMLSDLNGNSKQCILWTVNHYLGLNRHPDVIRSAAEALHLYGSGCGTSAMSVGFNGLHIRLKEKLEKIYTGKSVLLFPTGYTANSGSLSTLANSGDLVLFDREAHASILEGVKNSGAKYLPFKHNDLVDLEKKLAKYSDVFQNVFVVVESAYSMSGDFSPLAELSLLKERYKFLLYLDEAHTFGIYGEKGAGLAHALGIQSEVEFLVATLSKSAGSKGGIMVADQKYCTYLQCNSSTYIFQACLSPADTAAALKAIELFSDNDTFSKELHEKNQYFRKSLISSGFYLGESLSPIVPVFIPDLQVLYAVSENLYQLGVYTTPVAYPVVGAKEGRLRFIVNTTHSTEEIDYTVNALVQSFKVAGVNNIDSYFNNFRNLKKGLVC
ncbi:MAG: aminotransferase class I/II-fold pyridoxal phosphate-dependent enzyme [Verrucomicrobia bacterium]|nr:aminotransferase class I/II-fold pyridoxal phosphate-dependent enzyme [Verrucomicrobiota bacterium]MCH8512828.1 aminotransferase class I/II-fold pyridoxal phosphate-dependent enzyme [Kiritimatiellia bacterium]